MTPRVRRDGAWLRKAAPDAASGPELAHRSQLLAMRGVRTPVARHDAVADELVMPWIPGASGRDMLRRECSGTGGGAPLSKRLLANCLLPLVRLHETDPAGLGLRPLDPWRRIDPRLVQRDLTEGAADARAFFDAALRARRSAGRGPLTVDAPPGAAAQSLVHGDYHIGQLVFPAASGEPWLLDLDDLALGPPESDLGNFAAHLASAEGRCRGTLDTFRGLTSRLCPLYERLARYRLDRSAVDAYGAVALLRRALKLRERGASQPTLFDILSAAEHLAWAGMAAPAPREPCVCGDREGPVPIGGKVAEP